MKRHHLVTLALSLAACGGSTGPGTPELLAEVDFGSGIDGTEDSDTVTIPTGAIVCMGYGEYQSPPIGYGSPYPTGDTLIGCSRVHAAGGARAPITFGPGEPGFAAVTDRVTNGEDDLLWGVIYFAVDASLELTEPIGAASGEQESQAFSGIGSPDLTGTTVDSIRLVITSLMARRESAGTSWRFILEVAGNWQFWGRRGGG